jgi:hypothetical protein
LAPVLNKAQIHFSPSGVSVMMVRNNLENIQGWCIREF